MGADSITFECGVVARLAFKRSGGKRSGGKRSGGKYSGCGYSRCKDRCQGRVRSRGTTRLQWSFRLSGFFVSMCTVGLLFLPEVARVMNQSERPLIVGNQERHHPGNLFALANLLKPETKMQFVPIALEASWILPAHQGAVYLYSPTEQFRRALEKNNQVTTKLVVEDLFLQLWKVED